MKNLTLPILYAKASTGKIKQWQIKVDERGDNQAVITTEHGYTGAKITVTEKVISKGKNIGKANETTPYEQACNEAQSSFNKKKDKKYTENIDKVDAVKIILPMLAHSFEKRKHNIKYPAYAQPKLNGVRCLATKTADGAITFTSRKNKEYTTLKHLIPYLDEVMDIGEIFDGEIFYPGWSFQEIIRRVKKLRNDSNQLQYWIYDIAGPGTFEERFMDLCDNPLGLPLHCVETYDVFSEIDFMKRHKEFTAAGFEGSIIRNMNGLYKFDHRSADLQKHKDFIDAEFTIVGGKEGTGSDEGCVIFEVQNGHGVFSVRPKGTVELRQKWFNEIDQLIGKQLTVRYQELSEDGVPIFPVGIAIRDYE